MLEWVDVTLSDGEVGLACPRCLTDRERRAEHDYILDVPSELPRQASRSDAGLVSRGPRSASSSTSSEPVAVGGRRQLPRRPSF